MKEINVRVVQKPISINLVCPYCGETTHWAYDYFCKENGEVCDWDIIECITCRRKIKINNINFD